MAITQNQKVLTLDYWKLAGQLKAGDYVFDRNGELVKVKLVHPYFANNCYEVTFNDSLSVQGDSHLCLPIETQKYRHRVCTYKGRHPFRRPLKYFKASEILTMPLVNHRNRKTLSCPITKPLQFPTQPNLYIPPFLLGYWFFNHSKLNNLSFAKDNIEFLSEKFRDYGYKIIKNRMHQNGRLSFRTEPPIDPKIDAIPANYLLASEEQRLELLSGMLYAKKNPYLEKSDHFELFAPNARICGQICFLLESLSIKLSITKTNGYYRINFTSHAKLLEKQTPRKLKVQYGRRYIVSIKPIEPQMCVHVETESEDSTMLVGEGFLSTC
jgi:hypothetical protein